jgi:hypothetical protein
MAPLFIGDGSEVYHPDPAVQPPTEPDDPVRPAQPSRVHALATEPRAARARATHLLDQTGSRPVHPCLCSVILQNDRASRMPGSAIL